MPFSFVSLEAVVADGFQRTLGNVNGVLAQRSWQQNCKFITAETEHLARDVVHHSPQCAANALDQLIAGTMAEIVIDVFEVIDVEKRIAPGVAVEITSSIAFCSAIRLGRSVSVSCIARCSRRPVARCCSVMSVPSADALYLAVVIDEDARVHTYPAVFTARRLDVRDEILDLAAALKQGEGTFYWRCVRCRLRNRKSSGR